MGIDITMTTRTGSRSALLVVDVQTGVVAGAWDRDRIVANVGLVVQRAHAAGAPVVWVQHQDDELRPDTHAWEIVPELRPLPIDTRIDKRFNSAFEDTGLLARMDDLGVSHLLLCGAATNWCIRATAYAALDLGFDLTLVSDAHTTENVDLGAGGIIEARMIIEELNATLPRARYPGRSNAVATAAEVSFGTRPTPEQP